MASSLRSWGLAILVLGASIHVLPYLNVPQPGPPELGFYVAMAGGAMWLLGRVLK